MEEEIFDDMRSWRRHFHAAPELAYEEFETNRFVRSLLSQWNIPYESPLPTATVAHIRGDSPGPVLVVRADLDALPIQELSGATYASTHPGIMHACGHDAHTAILLGLARVLSQRPYPGRGEIRLLFQPAEEPANPAAPKLIDAGVLNDATAAIGLHVASDLETGRIGLTEGPIMAGDDRFDIRIDGQAGHAAGPHQTTDALIVAAGLAIELQTIVSRRVDPLAPVVVTVGTLNSGDVYNAIAGEARLSGTVRTLTTSTRDLVRSEVVGLATAYAAAHHATADVSYERATPPLINDSSVIKFVRPSAEMAAGKDRVITQLPTMGSEDFAFYSQVVPSAFAFIGAQKADTADRFPHHHPRFDIDENALSVGLRYLVDIVERWADPESLVRDLQRSR